MFIFFLGFAIGFLTALVAFFWVILKDIPNK